MPRARHIDQTRSKKTTSLPWWWMVTIVVGGMCGIVWSALFYLEQQHHIDFVTDNVIVWFIITAGIPWAAWVCPYLEVRTMDKLPNWRPRLELRLNRFLLWVPACASWILGIASIGFILWTSYSDWSSFREPRLPFSQYITNFLTDIWRSEGAIVLSLATLMAISLPISIWLDRHVKNLYIQNIAVLKGCFACGYDLTGNESGVCPECGESIGTEAQV